MIGILKLRRNLRKRVLDTQHMDLKGFLRLKRLKRLFKVFFFFHSIFYHSPAVLLESHIGEEVMFFSSDISKRMFSVFALDDNK